MASKMEKQYVVTLSRGDGCPDEELWGPACLEDCDAFVTGWISGYKRGSSMSKYDIEISIEVLGKMLEALRKCTAPFSCDPECPYYLVAAKCSLEPLPFCHGRMAGHVKYALETLQEIQDGQA